VIWGLSDHSNISPLLVTVLCLSLPVLVAWEEAIIAGRTAEFIGVATIRLVELVARVALTLGLTTVVGATMVEGPAMAERASTSRRADESWESCIRAFAVSKSSLDEGAIV
jgi:hypothetical protein